MRPRDAFGLVGTTIADRFRVETVIGEGGFGVVYGGTHLLLNVPVAIKCLKPAGVTVEERDRANEAFLREARILFRLTHPAIVRLYEVGVVPEQQVPYAVLELLRGTSLTEEIQARAASRRIMSRDDLLGVFIPILDGVGFAHEHGVIHRDLKPSNLMLVHDASRILPKVLDFGTARGDAGRTGPVGIDAASPLTQATAGFTPLYAAPEQWDGSFGQTGPHTDVFALGLTIMEACLLRYPFEDTSSLMGIFRMATDESKRPSLVKARPDLPVEVEQVLIRALHVRPEERYPDAREMLSAFRGALKASPTTAPLARPLARSSVPSSSPHSPSAPPMMHTPSAPPTFVSSPPVHAQSSPSGPSLMVQAHGTTTQPHALLHGAAPPPRRGSPLPWIIGVAGLIIAAAAIGLGIFVAWRDQEPAPTQATPAPPGAPTTTPTTAPSVIPAPTTSATAPRPKGARAQLLLESVQGTNPFWTESEILGVLRAHQAEVAACTAESAAIDPKLTASVSVTISPSKEGVVQETQCGMAKQTNAGTALCTCMSATLGGMKFPRAHGKLGFLDAAPFIASYRISPLP